MTLPTGTVTFLMTDIEGSTRLWELDADTMRHAHIRHGEIITGCVQEHGGILIKSRGEGDSTFSVFADATSALAAAAGLQRALYAERWPTASPIRVRAGIHTGAVEPHDGDYHSPTVNRCARLRAIAHGGQTLISGASYELVRDRLPRELGLKDLGQQRLKDLQRPERTYQLLCADVPERFPPLNSLDALPNNLPVQLTSFVGWEKELPIVRNLLAGTRLLTITGSGGCGKTRLSLQVAADLLDDYPDGVWFIELAPLSDAALVPQSVASALGVREESDRPVWETLRATIGRKRLLLVLDNCEHLLTPCIHLVDGLLRSCPNLQVIATSREGLGIAGETIYRVPGLSLPASAKTSSRVVGGYEAVRLFLERAASAVPSFTLTDRNAPLVAQICRRLDGIPLAIELAAARVKALPVEQIAARLDDAFRILTGGSRAALPRQQTLRGAIDWSYNLLPDLEQTLFRRLSVFAGGWSLEAAEAVCSGEGIEEFEIIDLLTALVEKSLVVYDEGTGRYRLLETVRQYAAAIQANGAESDSVPLAHYTYFAQMAEESERRLVGMEQSEWLARMEAEHDNFRAALNWCLNKSAGTDNGSSLSAAPSSLALRLAGALWRFWDIRGHLTEGRAALATALAKEEARARSLPRGKALNAAGVLAKGQGDYEAAHALFTECLAIAREIDNKAAEAGMLGNLGNVAFERGEYDTARSYLEQSLALSRDLHDTWGIANKLNSLGNVAENLADLDVARRLYAESLALFQEVGDQAMIATVLGNQGLLASESGDADLARTLHEQSLEIYRELGDKRVTVALLNLGDAACGGGDYDAARRHMQEGLDVARAMADRQRIGHALVRLGHLERLQSHWNASTKLLSEGLAALREVGDRRGSAGALMQMGYLALAAGDAERATVLLAATQALQKAIGTPLRADELDEFNANCITLSDALSEAVFATAWERGRNLTLDEAVAYATGDDVSQ